MLQGIKEIISEYASGKKVISELELDAAKSTLTYSLISQRSKKEQVIKRTWRRATTRSMPTTSPGC